MPVGSDHIQRIGDSMAKCLNPVCEHMVRVRKVAGRKSGRSLFHSGLCWRFFPPKVRAAMSMLVRLKMLESDLDLNGFVQLILLLGRKYSFYEVASILGMKTNTLHSVAVMYGLQIGKDGVVSRRIVDLEKAYHGFIVRIGMEDKRKLEAKIDA